MSAECFPSSRVNVWQQIIHSFMLIKPPKEKNAQTDEFKQDNESQLWTLFYRSKVANLLSSFFAEYCESYSVAWENPLACSPTPSPPVLLWLLGQTDSHAPMLFDMAWHTAKRKKTRSNMPTYDTSSSVFTLSKFECIPKAASAVRHCFWI